MVAVAAMCEHPPRFLTQVVMLDPAFMMQKGGDYQGIA